MKKLIRSVSASIVALVLSSLQAGNPVALSSKNTGPTLQDEVYQGGRGLLTIQRPTGLLINPTSGTLPAHAFTAQYCFFLPNNDNTPYMTHGALASFGVTDWLEIGGVFTARDNSYKDNQFAGGPLVRARLTKDHGAMPEISVGGYASFGDLENYNAFLALSKRFEISKQGALRSVALHAGLRETWIEKGPSGGGDSSDAPVGYFGLEVQLPLYIYLVGEVSTTDKDTGGNATPYGFGVQWRYGNINITTGFANPGNVNEPSFFFGIGTQLKF